MSYILAKIFPDFQIKRLSQFFVLFVNYFLLFKNICFRLEMKNQVYKDDRIKISETKKIWIMRSHNPLFGLFLIND